MSTLKPCPFCGKEVKMEETQPDINLVECLRNSHIEYYIECPCGAGMIDEDKEELIERWNTRIETIDSLVRDVEKWAYDMGWTLEECLQAALDEIKD